MDTVNINFCCLAIVHLITVSRYSMHFTGNFCSILAFKVYIMSKVIQGRHYDLLFPYKPFKLSVLFLKDFLLYPPLPTQKGLLSIE